MSLVDEPIVEALPLSQQLKAATHATHDRLDKRIMAEDIFADRARFARFVAVQHRFHQHLDALHRRADLGVLLPDLSARNRLSRISEDLSNLAFPLPPPAQLDDADMPLPAALGWLYVAEGSNLGGTVLFKMAQQKLGLDANTGAGHLAAHVDGAARHWREFTRALDAVALTDSEREAVFEGANAAFATVHAYVVDAFADLQPPQAG